MDALSLQPAIAKEREVLEQETAALSAMEDKLLNAVIPEIQALRVEIANGLQQIFTVANRIVDLAARYGSAEIVTRVQLPPEQKS